MSWPCGAYRIDQCTGPTSTFSRHARRSLALRPAHSRGHHFVTRYPKASDISSPPCLLRLLPAGANRRVGLAPTGKRRLVTAHPLCRHWPAARGSAQAGGNATLPIRPACDAHALKRTVTRRRRGSRRGGGGGVFLRQSGFAQGRRVSLPITFASVG